MRFDFEGELDRLLAEDRSRKSWALVKIAHELERIRVILQPRLSATLQIKGENMASILVGKTAQAVWQEFSGPNGTGDKLPAAGAVTFTSSNPSVATVDPSSGLVTAVAVGSATISGTDAANSLSASDTATGIEVAVSATLTVVPN